MADSTPPGGLPDRAGDAFGIDTTPSQHEPLPNLIRPAALLIPSILGDLPAPHEMIASFLVKALYDKGHSLAAAHWAIHEFVKVGRLTASRVERSAPAILKPIGNWQKSLCRPEERSEFRQEITANPVARPASYESFKVTATKSLWLWWKSSSESDVPKTADDKDAKDARWRLFERQGREAWPWAIWVLSPQRLNDYLKVNFPAEQWTEILKTLSDHASSSDSEDFLEDIPAGVLQSGELEACRRLLAVSGSEWENFTFSAVSRPSVTHISFFETSADPISRMMLFFTFLQQEQHAWRIPALEWSQAEFDFTLCRALRLIEGPGCEVIDKPVRVIDIPKSYRGLAMYEPRGSRTSPAESVSAWRAHQLLIEVDYARKLSSPIFLEHGIALDDNALTRFIAAPSLHRLEAASQFAGTLLTKADTFKRLKRMPLGASKELRYAAWHLTAVLTDLLDRVQNPGRLPASPGQWSNMFEGALVTLTDSVRSANAFGSQLLREKAKDARNIGLKLVTLLDSDPVLSAESVRHWKLPSEQQLFEDLTSLNRWFKTEVVTEPPNDRSQSGSDVPQFTATVEYLTALIEKATDLSKAVDADLADSAYISDLTAFRNGLRGAVPTGKTIALLAFQANDVLGNSKQTALIERVRNEFKIARNGVTDNSEDELAVTFDRLRSSDVALRRLLTDALSHGLLGPIACWPESADFYDCFSTLEAMTGDIPTLRRPRPANLAEAARQLLALVTVRAGAWRWELHNDLVRRKKSSFFVVNDFTPPQKQDFFITKTPDERLLDSMWHDDHDLLRIRRLVELRFPHLIRFLPPDRPNEKLVDAKSRATEFRNLLEGVQVEVDYLGTESGPASLHEALIHARERLWREGPDKQRSSMSPLSAVPKTAPVPPVVKIVEDASEMPTGVVRLAWLSYLAAEQQAGGRLTDQEAHDLLTEIGLRSDRGDLGELGNYEPPDFATWSRYLRAARKKTGESKYTKSAGRSHGKTIVKPDEI